MAKILKCLLLQIKANDQQRREAEQAVDEKAKTSPVSSSKEKGAAKISDKKGTSPPSPEGSSKQKTKLKRRDDVEPPKFIDDEPDDGPQHYILVLGFYQPNLIVALDAVGVHVANVIKLCSVHKGSYVVQQQHCISEGCEQSQSTSPVLDEASTSEERVAQGRRLDLFWSGLRPVLDTAPQDSKLHNVAQLSYIVQDLLLSCHPQDPEAVLQLGSQIFEGVARLIYDCLDCRRQHQHYLENVRFINVPVALDSQLKEEVEVPNFETPHSKKKSVPEESPPDQESELPPVPTDVDMRHYNNLLNLIPAEACSVPIILHCMLEQVTISTEQSVAMQSHEPEKTTPPAGPWLDCQLVSYMLQSFQPLVHTKQEKIHMLNSLLTVVQNEEDKKRLIEEFGVEETQKRSEHPLVIRYHDTMALRLRDISAVQGFDPVEVEKSMMKLSPVWKLINFVDFRRKSNSCWMALKQQLQHYCTDDDVSWPEVVRLFHQSVFEALPLTRLDQKGVLQNAAGPYGTLGAAQEQTPIIPWDDPLSYAKQQFHNLRTKGPTFLTQDAGSTEHFSDGGCSHLNLSDIQSCRLRSLFEWHYSEHHDASILPQVLQIAAKEYCCLDTFKGSHNNSLYIYCHNPMSPHLQSEEHWDVTLHTDVKFRKYLEHVADTIADWTREEELKREAIQLRNLSCAESPKVEKGADSRVVEDTLEPVIRKDSLKAWKLEQEKLKEEEVAKNSKKETPKSKQRKEEAKSADNKNSKGLSGGKRSRAETRGNSTKSLTELNPTTVPPLEENKDLHQTEDDLNVQVFVGYNMDGKLIHVSGCVRYLFPSDGGQITVENVHFIEGSSLMKLAVKKDGHHFYTHINQIVIEPVKPPLQPHGNETSDVNEDRKEAVEMKRVRQGSLSAVLNNGIHLSYSFHGPTGEYIVSPQKSEKGTTEASSPIPIHLSSSTQHAKGANLDSLSSKTCILSSENRHHQSQVCEGHPALPSSPFSSLSLSIPNGLLLQFLREDTLGMSSQDQGMLVRQSFPLHDGEDLGQLQDPSLSKELSRTVTSQGTVIRYMRDGSTEVLFADGSVSFSRDGGPVWVPDSEVKVENTAQEAENNKDQILDEEADSQKGCWLTTTPSGERICTVGSTHERIPTTPLLTFKATDPITHQVVLSREDLVVYVQNPDGSLTVDYADGTRITSLYQDRTTNTGDHHESVSFKAASECVCHGIECVCVTRYADNIDENMHPQDTCDIGEETCRNHAEKTSDEKDACVKSSEHDHVCDARELDENTLYKNVDKDVLSEETVNENDKMNAFDSEKGCVSNKERVVLVEKEGYATVVMYPERHMAQVFLADGTVITGNNQGAYQVCPSNVGILEIQSDGKCVYSSDPHVNASTESGTRANQPGSYTMSHADKVACDVTDPDGNHFQVMEDGQVSVLNFSPATSTFKQDEEELLEEEDQEVTRLHVKYREHCPRLFLIHEDGTGTEMLSSQTVEELLNQAYSDPTIALLNEPLPDTQEEFCITILKPSHQSVWSQWILGKQNPDIIPPNLRDRSWHDFPRVEKKSPGPPFGTSMGRSLTLTERSGDRTAQHQPVRSCPKVLEMRKLYQHRPVDKLLKNTIDTRLKEYIESLMEREQRSEEMKVKDPRTEEECARASDLLNLVLSFAEEEKLDLIFDKRTSEDIGSLYNQSVGAQVDVSDETITVSNESITNAKKTKWHERLTQYRQELCEEKDLFQHQTPDMKRLSMNLPPCTRRDKDESFLKDLPKENNERPTPLQSASHAAGSDRTSEKRPTNPIPQTAGESSLRSSSGPYKSVQVDVTGKPRRTKVRLPYSILSSKPCSVPNQQFLSLEEPVRRKCRTISLTNPHAVVRGFQLFPSIVDFGTLQEGTTSTIMVLMKNVGIDSCRFHVKQPPPATGLRVIYNPGPVAAGLRVELQVQLFAMCAAKTGEVEPKKCISQEIVIHTEKDIFYLPVTATILPERLHEIWLRDQTTAQKKKGSRIQELSSSSKFAQGITHRRPNLQPTSPAAKTGGCLKPKTFQKPS
ncbi:sperm-associated antigen 17 [Echeneis naucrates]|uniref:sperm-associated antigen 17 n=1 Tax=Echeneis naucrates TaxID=173247 RepID=UPI0011133C1F|nr:sperm-associated antigen 17 [Echeneis naucrates]